MPLSQTEINLVIKAQNQAQAAFDGLNTQLKNVIGSADGAGKGVDDVGKKTKGAGDGATAAGVAFGLLAERLARGLVSAVGDTIQAANRLDAGLIGLSSVATAFGQNADAAKAAAQSLASDGLMSVGEAATGLKNLLASGFSLPQAIELMNRFKDSAAFNRQAALGFGQAIASATEGIKNGNSILVDNAGVTKNLSNILIEAGFAATDVSKASTDASVRMALFNGIIKETNPQVGDAARLLQTAAGQQAIFNSQVEIASAKIGKQLQPALGSILQIIVPVTKGIGDLAPVIVPVGVAIAGLVIPIAAMRAAQTLGIGSTAEMTGALYKIIVPAEGATLAMRGLGLAVKGLLFYEAVKFVSELAAKLKDWSVSTGEAEQKNDSLANRLKDNAVVMVGSALSVLDYKTYVELATTATGLWDAAMGDVSDTLPIVGAAAKDAAGNIELFVDPITKMARSLDLKVKGGDELLAYFEKLSNVPKIAAERVAKWKAELYGLTQAGVLDDLAKELDRGVLSIKELSKEYGVSEDAISFYKKGLKDASDAQKENSRLQKEHQKAVEESAKAWEAYRIKVLETGKDMREKFYAGILDKVEAVQAAQLKSIQETTALAVSTAKTRQATEFDVAQAAIETAKLHGASWQQVYAMEADLARRKADAAIAEEDRIFTETTAALDKTDKFQAAEYAARRAEHEANVAAINTQFTTGEETKRAEIQKTHSIMGQLGTVTKTTFLDIQRAVDGSFAQMILGAKGFKDGFMDIWGSIKAGAIRILDELLGYFAESFIKGILKAIAGGNLGQALGGAFAVGGGGGGGLGGLLSSGGEGAGLAALLGLGGGGTGAAGGVAGVDAALGGGGTAAGGGLLASLAGPAAGGLLGGLIGYKTGSKTKGALSGIGAGAGIGAIFGGPVGAGIGAAVGGLAGLIGGWFGGKKDQKADNAATGDIHKLQDELIKTYGSLQNIDAMGQQVGVSLAGAWGDKGQAGLEHFKKLVADFTLKTGDLNSLTKDYGLTWADMSETFRAEGLLKDFGALQTAQEKLEAAGYTHDAVLKAQAKSYSDLVNKARASGTDIPESMRPVLEQLIAMGLLIDDNGKKYTSLAGPATTSLDQILTKYQELRDEFGDSTALDKFRQDIADAANSGITDFSKLGDSVKALQKDLLAGWTEVERAAARAAGAAAIKSAGPGAFGNGDYNPLNFDEWLAQNKGGRYDQWVSGTLNDFEHNGLKPPAAAEGVMAGGTGGSLVLFGEAGEQEVGGPRRFFEDVFRSMGFGKGSGGGGGQVIQVNLNMDGRRLATEVLKLQPQILAANGIRL